MDEYEVFSTALEIVSPQDRTKFLGEACAGDEDFRRRIEALLQSWHQADTFLASPAPNLGSLLHETTVRSPGNGVAVPPDSPRRDAAFAVRPKKT